MEKELNGNIFSVVVEHSNVIVRIVPYVPKRKKPVVQIVVKEFKELSIDLDHAKLKITDLYDYNLDEFSIIENTLSFKIQPFHNFVPFLSGSQIEWDYVELNADEATRKMKEFMSEIENMQDEYDHSNWGKDIFRNRLSDLRKDIQNTMNHAVKDSEEYKIAKSNIELIDLVKQRFEESYIFD